MENFRLCILAAETKFYDGECSSVVVPAATGYYGIMAHHSPLITAVIPGTIKFTTAEGETRYAVVSEGIVKVEKNVVLVLVDTAERPEDIDENQARRAAAQAKEEMLQRKSVREYHSAQAQLNRAIARIHGKNIDREF